MSLRGPPPHHCVPATLLLSKKTSQWWRAVSNTVSDLNGPRFGPQTSRSRDKRVTARPTSRLLMKMFKERFIQRAIC